MSKSALIKAVIAFDLVVAIAVAGYFLTRSSAPESPENLENTANAAVPGLTIYPQPIQLADFSLLDQRGNPFGRQDLLGAWTLLFFGFTSCEDVCPLTLAELKQFSSALAETDFANDTRIMMVSVDPARDTPAVLADYMARFDPAYLGLTGELGQISELASQLYIARQDPPAEDHSAHHGASYQVQHSAHIAVLDPAGQYRAIISAPHEAARLESAYRQIRALP
ncbi:MAG: hypothetical protein RLZZ385_724 [Pseudomonadota bacterium]